MEEKRLYTKKISRCDPISCPACNFSKAQGKAYSATKCLETGIYIATGTKVIPTKEQERDVWKCGVRFPKFCPLAKVE